MIILKFLEICFLGSVRKSNFPDKFIFYFFGEGVNTQISVFYIFSIKMHDHVLQKQST